METQQLWELILWKRLVQKARKRKMPNGQRIEQRNLKANVTIVVRQDRSLLTVMLQRRKKTKEKVKLTW